MKAVVYTKYGLSDVLRIKEVEKPTPKDDEALIKIYATSLNASDWELLRGKPIYVRLYGLFKPKIRILGSDIAGRVEAVGKDVKQFQPGDEVFGDIFERWGGFAEYVCARENALTHKPAGMTFEEAAALPQAACIALQGLRDKGHIQPGQRVLINGAGGGAGVFAVQIAKSFDAEVTGVDSADKLNTLRSIGADHVIDYDRDDFTMNGQCYDLILDLAAYHSMSDYKRALCPGGIYIMVGGSVALMLQLLLLGPWISIFGNKKMGILALKKNKDLDYLMELIETGQIVPVIDRTYPLNDVPEALRYLGDGRTMGKVVITMRPPSAT